MLKTRIIPVLMHDGIQVVKPVSFERPYRKLGTLWQYLNVMEERNVDELILLDIEATPNRRPPNLSKLRAFSGVLMCPITYGGGISSIEDIRACLADGADKVAIRTHIELIPNAAMKFGKQAIVGVVEYGDESPVDYARTLERYGCGELLLISRKHDGCMCGYDLQSADAVSAAVNIPTIILGGAGEPADFAAAISVGAIPAAASIFLYTEHTPRSIATQLEAAGHAVRV